MTWGQSRAIGFFSLIALSKTPLQPLRPHGKRACYPPPRDTDPGRNDSRDIAADRPEGYAGQLRRDKIQRDDEGYTEVDAGGLLKAWRKSSR